MGVASSDNCMCVETLESIYNDPPCIPTRDRHHMHPLNPHANDKIQQSIVPIDNEDSKSELRNNQTNTRQSSEPSDVISPQTYRLFHHHEIQQNIAPPLNEVQTKTFSSELSLSDAMQSTTECKAHTPIDKIKEVAAAFPSTDIYSYPSNENINDTSHNIYQYFVEFEHTDDKSNTTFEITSSANTLLSPRNDDHHEAFLLTDLDIDDTSFCWAIFNYNSKIYNLCSGYFTILDDTCTYANESIQHLRGLLYFVHDVRIRHYLNINEGQYWQQHDITVHIDNQAYTLKFFNGKEIKQCQALLVWKHTAKRKKYEKIHALYFPKPKSSIQWKWYDSNNARFVEYNEDKIQTLEFEAGYYANLQNNFPISNGLFRQNKYNTSMFDHCYLSRFNQLMGVESKYCMRYTLWPTGDDGQYEVVMDQIQTQSHFARSVTRYFDRQKYLEILSERIANILSMGLENLNPMITESGRQHNSQQLQQLRWISYFDSSPSRDSKYTLKIISNPDEHRSTRYTDKERNYSHMNVKTVSIKIGDLITNRCTDYMWSRFRRKTHGYCGSVNGYWDISFNDDEKHKRLREHLDAILTTLQQGQVQVHFEINTRDGGFLNNNVDSTTDEEKDAVLHITIDDEEYALLWYNTLGMNGGSTHAVYIKRKQGNKWKKMYIMYFPVPNPSVTQWQWYDNNKCKYMDYVQHNELLQLECSYLSNLYDNYPKHVICNDRQRTVGYFAHCIFTTHIYMNKSYVLRYSILPELNNKLLMEQVAYTNDTYFSRMIRRITRQELLKIEQEESVLRSPTKNNTDMFKDIDPLQIAVKMMSVVLIKYQKWLCLRNDLKSEGMLAELARIYKTEKTPKQAIIKLKNDFNLFIQEKEKSHDAQHMMRTISDDINAKLEEECGHKSESCLCVERAHRNRKREADVSKQIYFGFDDKLEIITQQILDSYHCVFLHLYDLKDVDIISHFDDNKTDEYTRKSSVMSYSSVYKKNNKFSTNKTYDTGVRFYYWEYYRNNEHCIEEYQDRVIDPGNTKENGKYYRFRDWFIDPAADNLKQEILSFGDGIGRNQYNEQYKKASIELESDCGRALLCEESIWENKYGLKRNDSIKIEHILALQLYCNFSNAQEAFTKTFFKQDESETDQELKRRHSKCALWAKYLRECVEGFGRRLQKGVKGITGVYFRGITRKFLFKKSILRFNHPMSTSVDVTVAMNFATSDGLILTLMPHWGDYGGYIRAFNCTTYSDFHWEEEYLFMGGLEPLVIHNIREVRSGGDNYIHKIHAMNNIYQIFEGMACKFRMKRKDIEAFIDNRLYNKCDDYMSQIFNFYCDDLSQLTIRLSLMDKSYKPIAQIFMDESNILKLDKIMKMFPHCKRVLLCDGHNYQLTPKNTSYPHTVLCVIENCLKYVNKRKRSLNRIMLESTESIDETLFNIHGNQLNKIGWQCQKVSKTSNQFKYRICRMPEKQ